MKKYIIFTVTITVAFVVLNLAIAGKMPKRDKDIYDKVPNPYEVTYNENVLQTYKTYAKDYQKTDLAACLDNPQFCQGSIESLLSRVSENKMVFVPIKQGEDNYFVLIKGYSKYGFVLEDGVSNQIINVGYEEFKEIWHSEDYLEKIYYYVE
ncbi:MAG: hypothetical protein IKL73_02085 [Lachnospiraceae bacterium]|nr:hypothetical protein [Lachnospiraceae bacterium]